ncbi:cytochrome B561 [Parvibaculum lavamentivorans DS-1]|uniref:Cytochrome B561 n=1 Tax=Parvibaculum lavamentivorans (strain DS-1 / DSM 13023 / NCIMB 13966) TaxID=402881 RepID=A7HTJ6_PARL1|nr:cytochrome b [Parvibaculum lavamentivorans]ABS63229.1 cytochrome B561 [Parvibaculum lavamentivorans DS-1]
MTTAETKDANGNFSTGFKSFHWAAGVLVLLMLYSGFTLSRETATWHFGTGIVVLVLMVGWLAIRGRQSRPPLPADMPRWQTITARATHHSLYLLVTLQPIFGLMMVTTSDREPVAFGFIPLKIAENGVINEIGHVGHMINAYLLTALVLLHIAGALEHHFIRRDNVLRRMLPFGKA